MSRSVSDAGSPPPYIFLPADKSESVSGRL